MIQEIIEIGRRIYQLDHWRECHRFLVFVARALLHAGDMRAFLAFFHENEARQTILKENGFQVEQLTRAFFYAGSTFRERLVLIENHILFEERLFTSVWFIRLNTDQEYPIWQAEDEGPGWRAILKLAPGQRKEGLLSIIMRLENVELYQMMFWFNKNRSGEYALYIGAMQGPNVDHARDLVKDVTKRAHRYRTKNLILYMTQAVARVVGVTRIYAVSNQGYYAMNHLRSDRKLKTDFGAFWEEAGGHVTDDPRFYELPLTERRKTMEEIPTRKRAVYRKRFAFQDDVDMQIAESIKKILRK